MLKCVFIVQGEGRGHMSQAIALGEYLEGAGYRVESVFVGTSEEMALPDYFLEAFRDRIQSFKSPYFLSSPNRKGIHVGRTFFFNLLRSQLYLRESRRIRKAIDGLNPKVVVNFYDLVGALAIKNLNHSILRIAISHHFLLDLNNYFGEPDFRGQRSLLKLHTRLIRRSCDRVLALSFSEQEGDSATEVVPPLIRREFREISYRPGERYLVYLLKEGFLFDLVNLARRDPGFKADVFLKEPPEIELPPEIAIYPLSGNHFKERMTTCKGLIATAGFDLAAEAAYHGIPLAVIPTEQHFEQKCNGFDIEQHGIGLLLNGPGPELPVRFRRTDPGPFRKWVKRSEGLLLNNLSE